MVAKLLEPRNPRVRGKLVKCATRLLNRRGYAATSVRAIVEAAGVTKPVLYHYFGSKEGIYREIVQHVLNHFEERLEFFRQRGGSAAARLRDLCADMFTLLEEHLDSVRLMYSIYYGPPQGAPHFDFDSFYQKLHEAIRQAVEEGVRAGEFRAGNVNDMAMAVMGALTVAIQSHLAHRPIHVGREGLDRVLDTIFSGMELSTSPGKVQAS